MDRRRFLAAGAAVPLLRAAKAASPSDAARRLELRAARSALVGAGYPQTDVWTYNGAVPGPELRFRQGERLRVEVTNALDVETTVHWHGVRLPNGMDGVPHVTQAPIAARGGRFTYEFELADAGTFWYHPHLGDGEQLGRGLYGALVVEEPRPPKVDRDLAWMLSDWRLDREARALADFASPMDASHAGRIGNTVTVNGRVEESFGVRAGERLRLRLINAANARIFALRFEGHEPWIIAHDGQPTTPYRPAGGRVLLAPGMRVDLMLDAAAKPGSAHPVVDDFYPGRAYRLLDLRYSTDPAIRTSFPEVPTLAANPLGEPRIERAQRHSIVFGGGAKGTIPSQREHRGHFWTINGTVIAAHAHHEPLLQLPLGSSHLLELVNETSWDHPIHLHGHVFRVLSHDGKAALPQHWADTVLLRPRSRAEVAFIADNPGAWMLHCHVLEHQASGMMALVRVG
jgi:FtsP/CotA-like multicopper oxidase with cupredoxin domain